MTITIKVLSFQDEKIDENNTLSESGTLKKNVTLEAIETDNNESYTATKWLEITKDKTDDDYVKEAYDAIKDDITVWQNSKKNIGKTFNPDTGKIE